MIFYAEENGKYIRGVTNFQGVIVYQEEITEEEYYKYIKYESKF